MLMRLGRLQLRRRATQATITTTFMTKITRKNQVNKHDEYMRLIYLLQTDIYENWACLSGSHSITDFTMLSHADENLAL